MKKSGTIDIRTNNQAFIAKRERYKEIIGSILFSMIETRLAIIFITLMISQFAKNLGY